MATPIRLKRRSRVLSYPPSRRPDTPLRALALNLDPGCSVALTEPYMLTVEHQRIKLSRLPDAFEGFRIVQLSDIHHGPFFLQGADRTSGRDRKPIEARHHWR